MRFDLIRLKVECFGTFVADSYIVIVVGIIVADRIAVSVFFVMCIDY